MAWRALQESVKHRYKDRIETVICIASGRWRKGGSIKEVDVVNGNVKCGGLASGVSFNVFLEVLN